MSYEYHMDRYLDYRQRLDNKEYRSETERKILEEHANIHLNMAADKVPSSVMDEVLTNLPQQNSSFPKFGDN